MVETGRRDRQAGFTLVEMLVAMGILVAGLTGLIGFMGAGVSTRASAELRSRAVYAVDQVLEGLLPASLAALRPDDDPGEEPPDLPAEPFVYDPLPMDPRLRATVRLDGSPAEPWLRLCRVRVSWREEGLEVGEDFVRLVDLRRMQNPFPARVGRLIRER